jgi:uncharacterized protein (DUF2062 family)
MLFKSRNKASLWKRLRVWLWPRISWRRSTLYYTKRVLRLSGSPYAIAVGSAIGAFISCTPFVGFHVIMTVAVAWVLRGNLIAGAIATSLGNPLTYPFLWAGSYELGELMLGRAGHDAPPRLEHDLVHKSWDQLWPLIEPMAVGSVPIGLAVGCVVYVLVYKAVSVYQHMRRERMADRRRILAGEEPGDEAAAKGGNG